MFAVIKTGGKQFRVAADDVIRVSRLGAKTGDIITFPVLMLGGDKPQIGAPTISDAKVAAEVIEAGRGDKVIAFKKRRRQNSKRKRGYRDEFTLVRITEILTDGKEPSKTARPKPERKPKEAVAAVAADADGDEKPTKQAKPKSKAKPAAKSAAKSKKKK